MTKLEKAMVAIAKDIGGDDGVGYIDYNEHDFEKYLNNKPISNKTILLKGSRGIELEKLVPFL